MDALAVRTDVPLAPFCTLGVGGPARAYVSAASEDALRAAAGWARERALPLFLLGGGSNLLVADEGFPGLVAHVDLRGVSVAEAGDHVEVTAAAGEDWDALVARAVAAGWSGLECLSGIPGRVGATPIQNVGAYGQDVSETIASQSSPAAAVTSTCSPASASDTPRRSTCATRPGKPSSATSRLLPPPSRKSGSARSRAQPAAARSASSLAALT